MDEANTARTQAAAFKRVRKAAQKETKLINEF